MLAICGRPHRSIIRDAARLNYVKVYQPNGIMVRTMAMILRSRVDGVWSRSARKQRKNRAVEMSHSGFT